MAGAVRYDYIDTLKGIAIMCVVLYHSQFITLFYNPNPLYPMLFIIVSGSFFRASDTWRNFFKKSLWGLMVPYVAFNLLAGVEYNLLHAVGLNVQEQHLDKIVTATFSHQLPNMPTWFLITLFIASLIFKCITVVTARLKGVWHLVAVMVLSAAIGAVGFYAGHSDEINIPLFPELSLTAVVLYAVGYLFSQLSLLGDNPRADKIGYCAILPATGLYVLLREYVSMAENIYCLTYWQFLLMMVAIYTALFYLCKGVGKIPFVTYMGRHSLLVLCTHMMILPLLMGLSLRFFAHDVAVVVSSVAAMVVLRWVVLPLCSRYLPFISGQGPHPRSNSNK